jgi:hypothetical protein
MNACHSERSEESQRWKPEILRFAQNDNLGVESFVSYWKGIGISPSLKNLRGDGNRVSQIAVPVAFRLSGAPL